MKKHIFTRFLTISFSFVLVLSMFSPVLAQRKPAAPPSKTAKVAGKEIPWAGLPWVVAGLLSAGTVMVGLKNAKRSHLD